LTNGGVDPGTGSRSAAAAAAHRPAIAAHRLIGDGRSAVLVRPDAEIDWWCAPDLDSPPLAWSLLDPHGGRARFPALWFSSCSRAPAGRTAWTTLTGDRGRVEVVDGLLAAGDAGVALVRLVRGLDRDLDVEHELGLGGFGTGRAMWQEHKAVTTGHVGRHGVTVTGGRSTAEGPVLRTRLVAERRRWSALVIAVDGVVAADPDVLVARLASASEAENRSLSRSQLPRSHPERALDALRVLRACTYAPTGAVVASPTTSLPEAPGHDRQYDYRYSWLRDASLAVSVAALLGQRDDAERYLRFVHRVTGGRLVPSGPVVTVRGDAVGDEQTVDVAGWGGSQPVRVGNDAAGQVQYDALGLLMEAVSVHLQTGGSVDAATWEMVTEVADRVAADPQQVEDSNGIWELRQQAPLVDGDIGRWLVLDRALWLARLRHPSTRRRHWKRARDVIGLRVAGAIDAGTGLLPQAYGQSPPRPDASALMAVVFGLLDPHRDPRARRLVDATIDALDAAPYLYRYPPDGGDGFSGREGAFLPVSAWAVTALAQTGQLTRARRRLDALCEVLPRLLPEEADPRSGDGLGNVPLVWSHMELARALYVLDAAQLRSRYSTVGLWAWRLGRYLRLRGRA